jgi:hypothetical protein
MYRRKLLKFVTEQISFYGDHLDTSPKGSHDLIYLLYKGEFGQLPPLYDLKQSEQPN